MPPVKLLNEGKRHENKIQLSVLLEIYFTGVQYVRNCLFCTRRFHKTVGR